MTRTLVLAARVALAVLVVLAVGTSVASVAVPLWITFEKRAAELSLRKLGASLGEAISGGRLVEWPQASDDALIKEASDLERLSIAHLDLPQSRFTSLEPLKGLGTLSSLDLHDAAGITSLEPLKGLTQLSSLTLINVTGITSLEPLRGLTNLSKLYLNDAKGITSLEPVKELGVEIYGASDKLLATMNSDGQ